MRCFTLLIVFLFFFSAAVGQDLPRLRSEFIAASSSAEAAEQFLQTTASIPSSAKPVLLAYKGAAMIIWSKYVKGIENKKKGAKEGIAILEDAVGRDPNNLESRTLRLSIQENSPKILKYKSNIDEDRKLVTQRYAELADGDLKRFVGGYLQAAGK